MLVLSSGKIVTACTCVGHLIKYLNVCIKTNAIPFLYLKHEHFYILSVEGWHSSIPVKILYYLWDILLAGDVTKHC